MTTVFLDTVGLLTLWEVSDQWHSQAEEAFSKLMASGQRLMTTELIFWECGNAAARKPFRLSVDRLRTEMLLKNQIIPLEESDVAAAWSAYRKDYAGGAGIVDQVSFEVMRRMNITNASTHDHHFKAAGFTVLF